MDINKVELLKEICCNMRRDCIIMSKAAGKQGFHFGGTLSMIEIVASLYFAVMNTGKDLLNDENRDRLILSKGHGVPAIYAALEQMGVLSQNDLQTFKNDDTVLYGHPSKNLNLGIECSSGSLGQGLSFAVGVSLALKRKGNNTSKIFVILGDGECNEGSVWEAALSASKYHLDNLVAIIDYNHLQYDGNTENILPMNPMIEKWESFGWKTAFIDGHNIEQCCSYFSEKVDKPYVIIADTVKGRGISFMENVPSWHYGIMTKAQEEQAMKEVMQLEV